jgi:hypothetical protein
MVSPVSEVMLKVADPERRTYRPVGGSPWLKRTQFSSQTIKVDRVSSASSNSFSATKAEGSSFKDELQAPQNGKAGAHGLNGAT